MVPIDRRRFLQLAGGTIATTMLSDSIARAVSIPANRATRSHRRRRAHRHPDAGEPVVRSLLRHAARRPRLQRSAPDARCPAARPSGTRPMARGDAPVPARHGDNLGAGLHRGPGPQLGRDPRDVQRRQVGPVDPRQDAPRRWRICSATTFRSTTRSPTRSPSAMPTTARCSARPTRTATTCGPAGSATMARAAVRSIANDEIGYSWTTYPERLERPASAGRSTRISASDWTAAGYWGWTRTIPTSATTATTRCCTSTSTGRPARSAAVPAGADRHQRQQRPGRSSTSSRPMSQSGTLPQVSWIVAPEAYTEHPNWPANYGAWYSREVLDALTANPDVWSKTALLLTFDENDGFFDHVVPPYAGRRRATGRLDRLDRQRVLRRHRATPGEPGVAGAYGWACGCR